MQLKSSNTFTNNQQYCLKAKNVFSNYKINDIVIVELDKIRDADSIQNHLTQVRFKI